VPGVAWCASPGPPRWRASGHPLPPRSGLYKPPPIKRGDAHHSRLPPRHHLSLPLALVRWCLHRQRGPGREPCHRIGLPLDERTPELEEECCRILFRTLPMSSASSMSLAIAVIFLAVRRWAPALANEDDALEPLDRDRSVAYRFGAVKWPDQWDPPVRFSFISFLPERSGMGQPVRV
jgi:hypothetical protein